MANEKLQKVYINYVFDGEKKIFENEGLTLNIEFKDNSPVIELLDCDKPKGLFQILDSAVFPKLQEDHEFFKNLFAALGKPAAGKPLLLTKSTEREKADRVFRIKHTANIVEYNILDFPTKNMDKIADPIENCCLASKNPEFKSFFSVFLDIEKEMMEEEGGAAKKKDDKVTLGKNFIGQITNLVNELNASQCHFVRCLKPNESKVPCVFWQGMVMN